MRAFSGLQSNPPGLHNFNYVFFPIPRNGIIRFKVKTGTEANIVLSRFAHHMNLPTREVRNEFFRKVSYKYIIRTNEKACMILTFTLNKYLPISRQIKNA